MNMSNGKCHLCNERNNIETLQHLFFQCNTTKTIFHEIQNLFQKSNFAVNVEEKHMLLGFSGDGENDLLYNIIIFVSKFALWKIRNKVKYDNLTTNGQTIKNIWKKYLENEIRFLTEVKCNKTVDKVKLNIILNNI